jgi:hypothetical protein
MAKKWKEESFQPLPFGLSLPRYFLCKLATISECDGLRVHNRKHQFDGAKRSKGIWFLWTPIKKLGPMTRPLGPTGNILD